MKKKLIELPDNLFNKIELIAKKMTEEQENQMNDYYIELLKNKTIKTLNDGYIFKLSMDKAFSLQGVIQDLLLCKGTMNSWGTTEGEKYKMVRELKDHYCIINDLGEEDFFSKKWFEKL